MLPYIKIYSDFIDIVRELDNGARGQLFLAVMQYANDEDVTNLTGAVKIAFLTIKGQIDRERSAYEDLHEKRSVAGKKGAEKKQQNKAKIANAIFPIANDSKISNCQKEKKRNEKRGNETEEEIIKKKFQKPTVDEVRAYCLERGNNIDAQRFVDHYEAVGWMVNKNPMKDWKAAVRTWEGRDRNGHSETSTSTSGRSLSEAKKKWGIV